MATKVQLQSLEKKLKEYKNRFLSKKYDNLDEASTRLMINYFLIEILGYVEFEEIKTEYRIASEYADYVIQIGRQKHFVVEVKSIQLDLNDKHIRQATAYAANEGIDWVLLTNGRVFALYRVLFNKPISIRKVFEHDIGKERKLQNISGDIILLTKKCVQKKELEKNWEKFEVVEPIGLSKLLYNKGVVSAVRKAMKQKARINFSEEDTLDALHGVITRKIESIRPPKPIEPRIKKKNVGKN